MTSYSSPKGLFEFQGGGIAQWYIEHSLLCTWGTGCGKALRNDQRVATPSGWRPIETIATGDMVLGVDGLPCTVTGVYPQGVRDMMEVTFSDGQVVLCDEDHLWSVQTRKAKWRGTPSQILTTKEILASGLTLPSGERKFFIPMASPVEMDHTDLPLDPYTLGALLGDGGLTQSPRLTTMDPDLIGYLVLPEGVTANPRPPTGSLATTYMLTSPRGQANPLLEILRELDCCVRSWEKHIPNQYLRSSIDQRWELLRGLLDTDGECGGSIGYTTTSRQLANDVVELIQSLGGTAKIREMTKTYPHLGEVKTGRLAYGLCIVLPPDRCPFKIVRKASRWVPRRSPTRAIISIQPTAPAEATCIAVNGPDSLYLTEGYVVTHNSHLSLAGGSILIDDGLIRLLVVVCEQNKIPEWVADFEEFTSLRVATYTGTPVKRAKIRESLLGDDAPQVLVTTYETSRNDLGGFVKQESVKGRSKKVFQTGPLTDTLCEVARLGGIAVTYDESTKLGNRYEGAGRRAGRWMPARGSVTYKAHEAMLKAVRKAAPGRIWVAGMTATPVETSPENVFNQLRLIAPHIVGSIADFEKNYVVYRDPFGRATYKNLTPDDINREPWVIPFSELIAPVLSHKSKTDADVRAAFPEATEEPMYVTLHKDHLALYKAIESLGSDKVLFPNGMSDDDEIVMFGILRQVAAHPRALLLSPAASTPGTLAHTIVSRVGAETLMGITCAKEESLLNKVRSLVRDQGGPTVIFSFFGQSVIPWLQEALEAQGYSLSVYIGSMSTTAKQAALSAFQRGETEILLASDAASRGLNIPQAQFIVNYELCLTDGRTKQRINRASRIGSGHASITAFSMIALDTIEEPILGLNLKRQGWQEDILPEDGDDTETIDAATRRRMFSTARGKAA